MIYHGSCLCKAVKYKVVGSFSDFYMCHCKYCRKDSGSAHASNLFSSQAELIWKQGEVHVKSFQLENTDHARSFCEICGSALPNIQMNGDLLVVPAGSLDSDLDKEPDGHIFISNKANWDSKLELVKKFERFPEPEDTHLCENISSNKPTIGILAGMGPRSTGPFLDLVLDQCQEQYGAKHDIDYPEIMIYSLPTPFYIDREIDEQALKESIKVGREKLERTGVDFIGIPCNSAHSYFEFITDGTDVPILNIVNETVASLKKGSRVSLFATEVTRKSGLYQEAIMAKSCEYIFEYAWQEEINRVILGIKNNQDRVQLKGLWDGLISKAVHRGVEVVIIACTDLNVVLDKSRQNITFVDSSQALAKGLVEAYLNMDS